MTASTCLPTSRLLEPTSYRTIRQDYLSLSPTAPHTTIVRTYLISHHAPRLLEPTSYAPHTTIARAYLISHHTPRLLESTFFHITRHDYLSPSPLILRHFTITVPPRTKLKKRRGASGPANASRDCAAAARFGLFERKPSQYVLNMFVPILPGMVARAFLVRQRYARALARIPER